MTQEEKARAYDEVIGKAQNILHTSEFVKITDLIPELAESEDERIKKAIQLILIATEDEQKDFYSTHRLTRKDCTDWLKKQKDSVFNAKYIEDVAHAFEDGRKKGIEEQQKSAESISQLTVQGKGVYKICPRCKERMIRDDSMVYTSMPPQYIYECPKCGERECDTVMYDSSVDEKQQEQKPILSDRDLTEFELEVHEIIAQARNDSRLNDADVLKQFEEEAAFALMLKANKLIEQKPAEWDKLQEDFRNINEAFEDGKKEVVAHPEKYDLCKPAEWSEEDITNGWKGADLDRYLSCLQRLGTGNPQQPETINSRWFREHCRPQPKQEWSEEDEKIRQSIIKDIEFERNYTSATTGKVIEKYNEQINWLKDIFLNHKKFTEAVDKLWSNEWSDEDETRLTNILIMLKEYAIHHYSKDDVNKSVDWLENRVKFLRPQPKQEWSEDDEKMLCNILNVLTPNIVYTTGSGTRTGASTYKYDKEIAWLKSLSLNLKKKNEDVAKLCSNEWSEKDNKMLDRLITRLNKITYNTRTDSTSMNITFFDEIEWLKSLRPSWKPSEHQMNILKAVKDYVGKGSGYWGEGLGSLIDDLEKLM